MFAKEAPAEPTFRVQVAEGAPYVLYACCGPEAWLPNSVWTIQSLDPLTVTPSVDCRACGTHGWIRDGKWVSV